MILIRFEILPGVLMGLLPVVALQLIFIPNRYWTFTTYIVQLQ